jgi:uncharacterized protein YndB with AHSA1/START domain
MHEEGGGFDGKVLRCEPPRLLAITWGGDLSSEVTFELTPQHDGKVLLTLTHRRLSTNEMANVAPGWHTHLGVLMERLSGREPENFWTAFIEAKAHYAAKRDQA